MGDWCTGYDSNAPPQAPQSSPAQELLNAAKAKADTKIEENNEKSDRDAILDSRVGRKEIKGRKCITISLRFSRIIIRSGKSNIGSLGVDMRGAYRRNM